MVTKGIIMAGGAGTRLYPMTSVVNKHLLTIFDKPMIYYPLTTLMLAGIRDILIISGPEDIGLFERLFQDGSRWGLSISYAVQERPDGLASAFVIGEEFIKNDNVCLILGDNIFYGNGFSTVLQTVSKNNAKGASIFVQYVQDPGRYGVASMAPNGKVLNIEEKPENPQSNYAVTGLYFYDNNVVEISKFLEPSSRGEKEITDVNNIYLQKSSLSATYLGRGMAWFDAGTPESIAKAGHYVSVVESIQNLRIACPEEVAYRMGYISKDQLIKGLGIYRGTPYGSYLLDLVSRSNQADDLTVIPTSKKENLDTAI